MMSTMVDPMQAALAQAFGGAIEQALQPLMAEVESLRSMVAVMHRQQGELLAIVDGVRAKGGMLAKQLGL